MGMTVNVTTKIIFLLHCIVDKLGMINSLGYQECIYLLKILKE